MTGLVIQQFLSQSLVEFLQSIIVRESFKWRLIFQFNVNYDYYTVNIEHMP